MQGHILELDGLRGIAILLVVINHAFEFSIVRQHGWIATLASWGFSGVDLFFVLSGFLITGILLDAKGLPAYFRNFYLKRALRIWPLYYLLLFVTFGVFPFLSLHVHLTMGEMPLLESRSSLVYVLLLQNLWYPATAAPSILAMTWSLAIEEQFYIVWPWLVLLSTRKKLIYILTSALVLSPVLRLLALLHGIDADTIYYLTPFRLDDLSLGALIAIWYKSHVFSVCRTKWAATVALAVGCPGSLWLLAGHVTHFKSLLALRYSAIALASAGTVMIAIWSSQTDSILGRFFRARWLRYLGIISYCLYLVHVPVYYALGGRAVKNHLGGNQEAAIFVMMLGFVVSASVSSLSWYMFESKILKLKGRLEYSHQMNESLSGIDKPGRIVVKTG
jgi:peptidoglycan/LPS O-acetylase OafA/YrhL